MSCSVRDRGDKLAECRRPDKNLKYSPLWEATGRSHISVDKIIGIITARGGSKAIPGKNIKTIAGRPLIAWTIEAAKKAKGLDRVVVSTDNADIAQVAREWGAEVPFMRPPELAQDDTSHVSVLNHFMDWLAANGGLPEYLFLLQPTAPLRLSSDIDGAIAFAIERNADAVVGVVESERHPYLIKKILPDGTMEDYVSSDLKYLRRQDFPRAYAYNGAAYVTRCTSLRRTQTFFPPGTYAYVMPQERSLDVDTPLDFIVVEQLLKQEPYSTLASKSGG